MTDSYHFESVAKFRVGGVYRNGIGCPCKVLADLGDGAASVAIAVGSDDCLNGSWSLATGEWSMGARSMHLIPGELVQRDGQWVAADAPIVFPSGAAVLTSGDKIVGRVEAGDDYDEGDDWLEPNRAPLPHFNQRTEFDAFPDFVVFHEFEPTSPLYDSPTTDSAYPAIAGLLRG